MVNVQTPKSKNLDEFDFFLFEPKYMKARPIFNDVNEYFFDDILPKKKEK